MSKNTTTRGLHSWFGWRTETCCIELSFAFRIVEFIGEVLTYPCFAAYCYVLWKRCRLHANLRVLLFAIAFEDVIFFTARLVHDVFDFTGDVDKSPFFTSIKRVGWISFAFFMPCLSGERLLSLLFPQITGNSRFPTLTITVLCVHTCFLVIILVLRHYMILTPPVILSEIGLFIIIGLAIFAVYEWMTKRRYAESLEKRFHSASAKDSLFCRYEANQHVRAAALMRWFVPFHATGVLINTALLLWAQIITDNNGDDLFFLNSLLYASVPPRAIGCMLIVLSKHDSPRYLCRRRDVSPDGVLRNVQGERISFESSMAADVYFKSYAW